MDGAEGALLRSDDDGGASATCLSRVARAEARLEALQALTARPAPRAVVAPALHRLARRGEAAEPPENEPVHDQRESNPGPCPHNPTSVARWLRFVPRMCTSTRESDRPLIERGCLRLGRRLRLGFNSLEGLRRGRLAWELPDPPTPAAVGPRRPRCSRRRNGRGARALRRGRRQAGSPARPGHGPLDAVTAGLRIEIVTGTTRDARARARASRRRAPSRSTPSP